MHEGPARVQISRNIFSTVKGILFDLDGVLHIGDEPIAGAIEALHHVKSRGIKCIFVTNTTTKSLEGLYQKIAAMSLPIEKNEIFSAPQAAVHYLRQIGNPTLHLILKDDTKKDFEEFQLSDSNPDFVVLGDIGKSWDYVLLNRIFRMIIDGATLVALHKGRYWQTEDGLQLDIGVFVAGLEYATGKRAIIMGKPSPQFFLTSLQRIGLQPEEVIMIGDDIESDIGGAQNVGMRGILVRTGKYRDELVTRSSVTPDAILSSVAELTCYL